jgi:D-cysteine desulfhydrase
VSAALDSLPTCSLGFFPTPVTPLPRLSAALGGPALFIKRDDQTGLALGGNKTRKLELLVGDALAQGADTLVTAGAAQSNHCRQTAAAAAQTGLACHLILGGSPPPAAQGNLLLSELLGAEIHWAGEERKGESMPALVEQLRADGARPYAIPYGGSSALGACGFVRAARELAEQERELGEPFTHVVFASSSGGTQAGLAVGRRLFGGDAASVVGVCIDKEPQRGMPFPAHVLALVNETAELLGEPHAWTADELTLWEEAADAPYGVVGERERDAIRTLARTEGVLLDPVYTARAMGGLLGRVREGAFAKSDRVLFWHTGGAPALFPYASDL